MSMQQISDRLQKMPISSVRKLAPYANTTKAQGVTVYHLNIGDPDIKTPECFIDALHNWKINPISYAPSVGDPSFLKSLVWYYHQLGYSNINESNIVATVGGSEAVMMALYATCDNKDEVLVFEPFYSNYNSCAAFCGVRLVSISTEIKTGFHLPSKKEIEKKITSKTKAILICSPNNPTGTVYTEDEFEMLVSLAKKHHLYLISDEVYREYVFDGRKHVSLLSFMEQIPNQTIVLDSLSKRYSLCGGRLGMVVSVNEDLIKSISKIAQSRLSIGLIDQVLGSRLTEVPKSHIEKIRQEYQKRRDVLYEGLLSIPGVFLAKPEGAFYTMVELPVKNAEDFCIFLLKEFCLNNQTVMLAPGSGFYGSNGKGVNQVRIAYVLNEKNLRQSIEVLRQALKVYKGK